MQGMFKSFAGLLILLVMANPPIMQAQDLQRTGASQHDRLASCHEHGRTAPVPQPVSYRCCVAGHDMALVQGSVVVAPALGAIPVAPVTDAS
jgi:hypothetical protein